MKENPNSLFSRLLGRMCKFSFMLSWCKVRVCPCDRLGKISVKPANFTHVGRSGLWKWRIFSSPADVRTSQRFLRGVLSDPQILPVWIHPRSVVPTTIWTCKSCIGQCALGQLIDNVPNSETYQMSRKGW